MAELIYELSFKGVASSTVRAAFADAEVRASAGVTLIRCSRSALSTVIDRIEELGLELIEVRLLADQSGGADPRAGEATAT